MTIHPWRTLALSIPLLLLAGCGGVAIKPPEPDIPQPLIEPFPADVGVYCDEKLRTYVHTEERWGSKWEVDLGESHVKMLRQMMTLAFRRAVEINGTKAQGGEVDVIFQPHIERYSFITPRDSGGSFFAVTIRYRFDVYTPEGQLADTLTLTGYGGAPATSMTSTAPMIKATQAAMRDAVAKFLVQFPSQRIAQRMRAGEPLIQEQAPVQAGTSEVKIEPVPIFPDLQLPPPGPAPASGSAPGGQGQG